MKHLLLVFMAFWITGLSFGMPTLSGTYTIPGSYPTLSAAIADLNSTGVGPGGVIFNVAAGYNESTTGTLVVTATGTVANPIIFQKDPSTLGPNPKVTATFAGTGTPGSATQDGIWAFLGSDYVTVDGIDLLDPNTGNPASMEYGYGMFKLSPVDGCQHNVIRNCTVTLNRGNNASGSGPAVDGSRAVNVVNALISSQTTAVVVAAPQGSNSDIKIYANTLQNCNIGVALIGYVAPSPFTLADQGNDVGGNSAATGNSIINYGGAPAATNPAAGVRTQNQYGLNVSFNMINNNNGLGVNHQSTLRGIFLQAATSANATVSNNILSITGGSTTSQISVIENVSGSTAAGNTISISNNIIQNCSWPTATTGVFYAILNSSTAAVVNISGNQITGIMIPSTGISYMINGGGPVNLNIFNNEIANVQKMVSGTLYGIFAGTTNLSVHHNNVHHFSMAGGGNAMYGLYDLSSPTNESYFNNNFYNFTNNGTGGVFGIYTNTAPGTRTVYLNTINTFAAVGGGPVYGIYGANSSPSYYRNRIYDLSSGTAGGIVYGIYIVSGNPVNIYNNYICDLRTPAAAGANVLSGIFLSITTTVLANVFYNTVYLDGNSSGAPFSSAALYANTIPTLDMRDNILINNSTPTGAGIAAAYRRNNATLGTYSLNSNNNNFYAGTPGPSQVIFYDGTTTYPTLAAYQALVGPGRDAASFTENSPFVNIPLHNLHINPSMATQCESGGVRITAPIAVTDDWDADIRWGEPGYTGTGTAPDVGADEFNHTVLTPVITGTITDTLGVASPAASMYIQAHTACNPSDTLSTLNGGIIYTVDGGIGTYTVNYGSFLNPPVAGDLVYISFTNLVTLEHQTAMVTLMPGTVTTYNVVIRLVVRVHLPNRTSFVRVVIPPHRTLQIHYVYVEPGHCGNTDVFVWNGTRWVKYKQWNWNHYCTWRYIQNNSNRPMVYVIHNDNGDMVFDLMFNCPNNPPSTPGNNGEYGLINMGWRDAPNTSCEFGNIVAPNQLFIDQEGAFMDNFPQRLGDGGVMNLTIQFESYSNMFWNDMNLMIDLTNVTQGGTLVLNIPDATIPVTTATINPGDAVCFFNPGGIMTPGIHMMTLSAQGGLAMGMDCFNFASNVPSPFLPTVTTTPVTGITSHSALSGGNVSDDGGAPVIARGVCWSTLASPTILDNITMDGTGLGPYVSMMSPLAPLTTYHMRAYASNFSGTAYGQELIFTTHSNGIITGNIADSNGVAPPVSAMYIQAHTSCNPSDTLSTLNGGITYSVNAGTGTYVVHYSDFMNPLAAGDQVYISFTNLVTLEHQTSMVTIAAGPVTNFNVVVRLVVRVHLPNRTSFVRVVIPPHRTLQIHYVYVAPGHCGNTDVFVWNGTRWVKHKQWNWNHYCTWRYIQNNSNRPMVYVIHNDNGDMVFDLMFNCPNNPPTTPGNNGEYALVNMGWRDAPNTSCEFGNIVAPNHVFIDQEGAFMDNFPQRLGNGGVMNLTIQFESYSNMFWNDMNLMIDLTNVTQGGTLVLNIPDATIPVTTASINPGDVVCNFNPGGIMTPGTHIMTLSAQGGLSMGMDCFNLTSNVPAPFLPTVTTAPVTGIMATSAISGGNISDDGGAPVIARGVCWSTLASPTILDNTTTDGTGTGAYVSMMSPLMPSTTYHMRAYASNFSGTAYGNELVFTTNALVPAFTNVQNVNVGNGQNMCYNATQTIVVGGGGTSFNVMAGGSATFIAGHNILFQPETKVFTGGYMHGFITTTDQYCPGQSPSMVNVVQSVDPQTYTSPQSYFTLYPNPTNGNVVLEQKGDKQYGSVKVEVYGMRGEKVMATSMTGEKKHEFSLSGVSAGLYFVRVIAPDGYVETIRLIVTK